MQCIRKEKGNKKGLKKKKEKEKKKKGGILVTAHLTSPTSTFCSFSSSSPAAVGEWETATGGTRLRFGCMSVI
jgi:hypothetical protein